MRKPLEGNYPVTQTFAEHLQRKIDNGWKNYNGGIDYGVPIGTPIYAAQNGQIEKVADDPSGYGTHILISHSSGLGNPLRSPFNRTCQSGPGGNSRSDDWAEWEHRKQHRASSAL